MVLGLWCSKHQTNTFEKTQHQCLSAQDDPQMLLCAVTCRSYLRSTKLHPLAISQQRQSAFLLMGESRVYVNSIQLTPKQSRWIEKHVTAPKLVCQRLPRGKKRKEIISITYYAVLFSILWDKYALQKEVSRSRELGIPVPIGIRGFLSSFFLHLTCLVA